MRCPLGRINILLDGVSMEYQSVLCSGNDVLFPDVEERHHIIIDLDESSQPHEICCVLESDQEVRSIIETGENLEINSFYNNTDCKLSIGCYGDNELDCFDYQIQYLDCGMMYQTRKDTKTKQLVFAVSWIKLLNEDQDIQTWFASDPKLNCNCK